MKKYINTVLVVVFMFCSLAFSIERLAGGKQEEKPITLLEYKKRVANKEKIVLVYFSADWCAVCAKMKPILAEIETVFDQKMEVLRIDTDRDKEITNEFEVNALPILILYKNGVREWIYVGLIDKKALKAEIEPYGYDISHNQE